MELSDSQRSLVLEKICGDVEMASQLQGVPEETKLAIIGIIAGNAIAAIQAPVTPSILPQPDDITIGRMAKVQKMLRQKNYSTAVAEEIYDKCLHIFLKEQKSRESLRN